MRIIWNNGRFKINLTIVDLDMSKSTLNDILPIDLINCRDWRITNETGNNLSTISASFEKRKIKDYYYLKTIVKKNCEKIKNK